MFERILVTVDGSKHAMAALRLAVEMQQKLDSELFILCVYRHYSLLEASMSMAPVSSVNESPDESMREYATSVVDNAKKFALEHGARHVRGFVKSGPPARTIVSFAKNKKVSLIMLGSRGLGDVEGYLLGSVSHKVTGMAGCPVMVV